MLLPVDRSRVCLQFLSDTTNPMVHEGIRMIFADPIHAELRSAINIKKALDCINYLEKLDYCYCPTKVQEFRDEHRLDNRDDTPTESKRGIMDRGLAIQVCNPGYGLRSAAVYPLVNL